MTGQKRDIYLDNSATTRCFPEAAALMNEIFLEDYGNPSSMHHRGVTAERRVLEAKKTLAGLLKVKEKNLYFTSCGTESDNLAIIGGALAAQRRGRHLITTRIEHPAVLEAMKYLEAQGFEITYLGVDRDGLVSAEEAAAAVRPDTILVSVMHTNNEIGSVQPIEEIGRAVKAVNPRVLFHVDAVQGFGKALILPKRMHIDLLAASGHKIHGPKGVGLLYVADGVRLEPLLHGGGQQGGMRSGTENVPGIAGMALAAKLLCGNLDEDRQRLFAMKNRLIDRLREIPDIEFNGRTDETAAPHILSVRVRGVRAEVLLHALEDKGIYVSSGSACSSNHPRPSETLAAIGTPASEMDNSIRMSLSVMNTMEEMDAAAQAVGEIVPLLRKYIRR
ncbi:MAG: cysteine desulfurase family protein [Lachnospiraceae bacterium]|nr:cysteine desulfurase family protein [Lachnospiraceae bacterium]